MLTQEQIQEKCDGEVYTLKEFCELCNCAAITSYDGHGYFHDGEKETDVNVFDYSLLADEVWDKYKYVCWYNK